MKHNKITISILMIFVILLSVGCSNKQENIPDSNEFMHLIQKLIKKFLIMQMKDLHTVQHIKL